MIDISLVWEMNRRVLHITELSDQILLKMWGNFNLSSNHINHSGLGVELIYKKELNNTSLAIKNVFNSNTPL